MVILSSSGRAAFRDAVQSLLDDLELVALLALDVQPVGLSPEFGLPSGQKLIGPLECPHWLLLQK